MEVNESKKRNRGVSYLRYPHMALETALPAGEASVSGEFLLDPAKMVVFEPPLVLYTPQANFIPPAPEQEFQFRFNEAQVDRPEFVDVGQLAAQDVDAIAISDDDDDDVIFVGEYRERKEEKGGGRADGRVRRNPVRKTRSTKTKDALYEDDFAFLDHSDEENLVKFKRTPIQKDPNFKQWPINVHDRPEYNPATKKIENFDYTIREIQKTAVKKKPRIECVPVRKKSKKNYCSRRRKPRPVVVKKVAVEEIKELVNENFQSMKQFLNSTKEYKSILKESQCKGELETKERKKGMVEFVVNQATLYSIVNDLDVEGVVAKLSDLKAE